MKTIAGCPTLQTLFQLSDTPSSPSESSCYAFFQARMTRILLYPFRGIRVIRA